MTATSSAVIVKSEVAGPSVVVTCSENLSVISLSPLLVNADTIIGAVVSITKSLPSLSDPVSPGEGSVRVAEFPAKSVIRPDSAVVDE